MQYATRKLKLNLQAQAQAQPYYFEANVPEFEKTWFFNCEMVCRIFDIGHGGTGLCGKCGKWNVGCGILLSTSCSLESVRMVYSMIVLWVLWVMGVLGVVDADEFPVNMDD